MAESGKGVELHMNQSQQQNILNAIQTFEKTDFDTPLASRYKDQGPLEAIVVGDYPVLDALALAKKVVRQLKVRLNTDDWQILPFAQNMPEYGPINIENSLNVVINNLSKADYNVAIPHIKALVFYQMSYGFWNIPEKIELGIRESSLRKLEDKVQAISQVASQKHQDSDKLIDNLKKKQDILTQWINEKNKEYQTLKDNQAESNTIIANIRNTESNTKQLSESIEAAKQKADSSVDEFSSNLKVVSEQLASSQDLIKKANAELDSINRSSAECLESVKKNLDETNTDVAEIKKMMGYIGDGTLGHSFNQRQQKINRKANFWLVTSLVLFFATIAWIIIVFAVFDPPTQIVWANILINAIKSSLAVFAFGYALNEYGKERNLQEEYAFRESVALTLTAYLNKLETCEKEEMKTLLMETIEKLYTKPVISPKEYKLMKPDLKEIGEMVKPIADIVKPAIDKGK